MAIIFAGTAREVAVDTLASGHHQKVRSALIRFGYFRVSEVPAKLLAALVSAMKGEPGLHRSNDPDVLSEGTYRDQMASEYGYDYPARHYRPRHARVS